MEETVKVIKWLHVVSTGPTQTAKCNSFQNGIEGAIIKTQEQWNKWSFGPIIHCEFNNCMLLGVRSDIFYDISSLIF